MPSGRAVPTSIFLITVSVFVSNIDTGLLLENPWPDLGSTATPLPPLSGISPTGASVSRLNTVMRPGTAPTAGAVSGAGTARVRPRPLPAARNIEAASGDVRVDVVEAAVAADLRGLEHFVRTARLCLREAA